MSETREKLILQRGIVIGAKSPPPPSPTTKLLINHGKPNFTIQKGSKDQSYKGSANVENEIDKIRQRIHDKSISRENVFVKTEKTNGATPQDSILKSNGNVDLDRTLSVREATAMIYKNSEDCTKPRKFVTKIKENRVQTMNEINLVKSKLREVPKDEQRSPTSSEYFFKENGNGDMEKVTSPKPPLMEKPIFEKPQSPTPQKMEEKPTTADGLSISPSEDTNQNFQAKTVVSFSKDLATTPNRYPDTVKITSTIITPGESEFAKLRFKIDSDGENITPVIE